MDNNFMLGMMLAQQSQAAPARRAGCGCSPGCLMLFLLLVGIWFPWELVIK